MKKALLVGIDDYQGMPLRGCVNDATAMSAMLARNADHSPNYDVSLVVGGPTTVTRASLRRDIESLFSNSRDMDVLFFFAGHGAQTGIGAELVTQDATQGDLGIPLTEVLNLADSSPARSCTIILDCCFSGDAGNLSGLQDVTVSEQFRIGRAVLREGMTILAASSPTQESEEKDGQGAFTRLLLDGLEGGATDHLGRITALSLFAHVAPAFGAWEQRPMLKTHSGEATVLRVGPPWLDVPLLRELPEHFSTANAHLQLTPAHEGIGRPLAPGVVGTPQQQEFDYLARLRNANLVTSDGRRDHYWLAMESGSVYLTQLGQYFWRLAKQGRL